MVRILGIDFKSSHNELSALQSDLDTSLMDPMDSSPSSDLSLREKKENVLSNDKISGKGKYMVMVMEKYVFNFYFIFWGEGGQPFEASCPVRLTYAIDFSGSSSSLSASSFKSPVRFQKSDIKSHTHPKVEQKSENQPASVKPKIPIPPVARKNRGSKVSVER